VPATPAAPAAPCGPTPPAIDTDELKLVTAADTPLEVTVAEIGWDVTVAETLLTALPQRLS
jgi:hypothetical protein